jgi:hypothetical protein
MRFMLAATSGILCLASGIGQKLASGFPAGERLAAGVLAREFCHSSSRAWTNSSGVLSVKLPSVTDC